MHRASIFMVVLVALASSVRCVPLEGNVTQRFFTDIFGSVSSFFGVLGEDLSELLTYTAEDYLYEDIDFDEFPDPFEYNLDELQKMEESIFGLFPFGIMKNADTRNTVRATTCVAENTQGTCIDKSTCTGKSVAGLCPGASNIQCCIPQGTPCSANGKSGVCISVTSCQGATVAGLCPGSSSIQCCIAGGTNTGVSTGSACGNYAGAPTSTIIGNGNKAYTVVKIRSEHLSNPSSYSLAADKSDNTMTTSTACAFDKMMTAAKASGVNIKINSGFRTIGRQQYFWNCYQTKQCNGGNKAARVGTSNHGRGIALDLNTSCGKQTGPVPPCGSSAVYQWLKANAHKYGFTRTVFSEPWHWEFRGLGVAPASYT